MALIFESIDCPLCSGEIRVVVEENKIVSHGICPTCDETFSSERLQFTVDCLTMEEEFMVGLEEERLLDTVEIEVIDFYYKLMEKGVEV
jgi:hypothetical protein